MEHILNIDDKTIDFLETNVFPKIYTGNTVLFLGAGASVGEKKFLSGEIIEYYQESLSIDLGTKNLIEFMDILKSLPTFNRDDFDNYVVKLLAKLSTNDIQRKISCIPWREIITTNQDLLIEKAFDEFLASGKSNYKIIPVRSKEEYHGHHSPTDIRYVKLNGCISDKRRYPLVYSSEDFEKSRKYYRLIFNSLENLSPNIQFLSIGFSFSDGLSKDLLMRFDSFNYRNKKWIISLDPFVNEHRLPYFTEQRVCIIKITSEEFFKLYSTWEEFKAAVVVKRKGITFTTKTNENIIIPTKLKLNLGNSISQLSDNAFIQSIPPLEFYKGTQPTYDVVRRNYDAYNSIDVLKAAEVVKGLLSQSGEKFIPVLFLKGDFGIGKSTFTYRVIFHLLHADIDVLSYEITEPDKLSPSDLGELFRLSSSRNILLLCNELEVDSAFKDVMALRNSLSIEQFSDFNIVIISSIRSNILQRHFARAKHKNCHEYELSLKFRETEALDLVEKIAKTGLISYRDAGEKEKIIRKILTEYDGDTFISLISLIAGNQLNELLFTALRQLSQKAQEAFLYTSILYQFKMLMPGALLMKIISKDWEHFKNEILEYDCKGILIQEVVASYGSEPDLFFRTRHPIISQKLITAALSSEDKLFERIRKLISHLHDSHFNAQLLIDLFKALADTESMNQGRINKLYDFASDNFEISPHFNLHYAINLQHRDSVSALKRALQRLVLAGTSELEQRNHYLIHRRGVIHFELAKHYRSINNIISCQYHIDEARELFEIKRIEDPFSSFSYFDFLRMELWCIKKLPGSSEDLIKQHIQVQELFDLADRSVTEDFERIIRLRSEYYLEFRTTKIDGLKTMPEYVDELYGDESTRAHALVLKYNYLIQVFNNRVEAEDLIPELESYSYNYDVARLLFKYYGRKLHLISNRLKYFKLVSDNTTLKSKEKVRYNFYSYVAEAYNRNFQNIASHLNQIRSSYHYQNPDLSEVWLDEETNKPQIFEAIIVRHLKGKLFVRVSDLQQQFSAIKSSTSLNLELNTRYLVRLHFFLRGIGAEIIEKIVEKSEI